MRKLNVNVTKIRVLEVNLESNQLYWNVNKLIEILNVKIETFSVIRTNH